jgi:hypothetical protein
MSKDKSPDNRKARKKKNIGKIPPTLEDPSINRNVEKQANVNTDV